MLLQFAVLLVEFAALLNKLQAIGLELAIPFRKRQPGGLQLGQSLFQGQARVALPLQQAEQGVGAPLQGIQQAN